MRSILSCMSTYQASLQFAHRSRKRVEVEEFFLAHIGEYFSSYWLHVRFGQGVRSRISDINNDPAATITIRNTTFVDKEAGQEVSGYVAELHIPVQEHRDDG